MRDYAGYPEILKYIIKFAGPVLKVVLGVLSFGTLYGVISGILEILKSGVPQVSGCTGDMDAIIVHDEITWYDPGATSYWFRVGLSPKSTRAIKVKALRGHTIQLVTPDGVV